jgi:5-methylcytosine-specific restriction enzyme A
MPERFTADELVLMLDFILEGTAGVATVPQLSALLRNLPSNQHLSHNPAFRSEQGLRTSLGYLREIHESQGNWPPPDEEGNQANWRPHFKDVWRAFGPDPERLRARVVAILVEPEAAQEVEEPALDDGFVEGRTFTALHRRHERSQAAVRLKKDSARVCEVCDFDFEERYGERGAGYIECHHLNPIAETGETVTRAEDLVLVCANCHRMLHRGTPPPSVADLQAIVAARAG